MDKVDLNHYQNIELITQRSGSNYTNYSKPLTKKAIDLLSQKNFIIQKFIFHQSINLFSLGSEEFYEATNHPVHIQSDNEVMAPTALIPFCEFGGSQSAMGDKIDQL